MSIRIGVLIASAVLLLQSGQAVAEGQPRDVSPAPIGAAASALAGTGGEPVPAVKSAVALSGSTCSKVVDGKQACLVPSPLGKVDSAELRRMHASAVKPADVIPLPDWCYNYSDAWYFLRTEACAISASDYLIFDTSTGALVGGLHFVFWWFSFTSVNQTNWQSQVEFQPTTEPWGLAVGSVFQGSAYCSGVACSTLFSNFPSQAAVKGVIAKGDAQFRTSATNPSAVGFQDTFFDVWFNSPCCGPSTSITSEPPRTRCDNATPGNNFVGCVFPDYTPMIVYTDSSQYCCPEVARHIGQAQGSGLPSTLTRLTDPALIDSNGRVACKDSYVRPPGKSCDEYPFRSSWQGARTGGGSPRTFDWCQIPQVPPGSGPAGYSVCMVNAQQNGLAGTALGSFYSNNRVIDNEPFRVLAN